MSIAPRLVKWHMRAHRWPGQSTFVQNVSLSPSRRTSGPPHTGHVVGNFLAFRPFGRSASTGLTTSGMTSPALRTITVSAGRVSLPLLAVLVHLVEGAESLDLRVHG